MALGDQENSQQPNNDDTILLNHEAAKTAVGVFSNFKLNSLSLVCCCSPLEADIPDGGYPRMMNVLGALFATSADEKNSSRRIHWIVQVDHNISS